jgi:hypothetical protein
MSDDHFSERIAMPPSEYCLEESQPSVEELLRELATSFDASVELSVAANAIGGWLME